MTACLSTLPAPPDVYALSALRPEMWSDVAQESAEDFAFQMKWLDTYGRFSKPFNGGETLAEHRTLVRKAAAKLCSVVYANSDAPIDEEDIDHAATVASWILGRKVEVSGWWHS